MNPYEALIKNVLFFIQTCGVMFSQEFIGEGLNAALSYFSFTSIVGPYLCYQGSHIFFVYMALLQPLIGVAQLCVQGLVMFLVHVVKTKKIKGFHTSAYRRSAITLLLSSYYGLVHNVIKVLVCVDVGTKSLLQFEPAISCTTARYGFLFNVKIQLAYLFS
jgi:hypothetical protein